MPTVRVRESENIELALRRFKRAVDKAGVLSELRRRETYEKPAVQRKREKAAARKRLMKHLEKSGMLALMQAKTQRRKKRPATRASARPAAKAGAKGRGRSSGGGFSRGDDRR